MFRTTHKIGLLKSIYLGFFAGLIILFLFEFISFRLNSLSKKEILSLSIVNCIIYFSMGYCYFNYINLGETARRIRILREIYDSKEGLSMEEILKRYNAKEIIERRIKRLLKNRQIIYKDGKYYIGKPIMLVIAKIIVIMKVILLGKKSEFGDDIPYLLENQKQADNKQIII